MRMAYVAQYLSRHACHAAFTQCRYKTALVDCPAVTAALATFKHLPMARHTAASTTAARARNILARLAMMACALSTVHAEELPKHQPEPPLLPFDQLFVQPMGPRGAEFTPQVLRSSGRSVRLVGYMVHQERAPLGHFILTPRPVQMSENADGDADDLPLNWVLVQLDPSQESYAVAYQSGLLELRGTLETGRLEAPGGRVSWIRLRLDTDATRGMTSFELSNYLHAMAHRH